MENLLSAQRSLEEIEVSIAKHLPKETDHFCIRMQIPGDLRLQGTGAPTCVFDVSVPLSISLILRTDLPRRKYDEATGGCGDCQRRG